MHLQNQLGLGQHCYREINQANDWFDELERSLIYKSLNYMKYRAVLLKDWDMTRIMREGTNEKIENTHQ